MSRSDGIGDGTKLMATEAIDVEVGVVPMMPSSSDVLVAADMVCNCLCTWTYSS
jgi:hypothetical protein